MVKLLRSLTLPFRGIYRTLLTTTTKRPKTERDEKIADELERWREQVRGQTTKRHSRCQCAICRRDRNAS